MLSYKETSKQYEQKLQQNELKLQQMLSYKEISEKLQHNLTKEREARVASESHNSSLVLEHQSLLDKIATNTFMDATNNTPTNHKQSLFKPNKYATNQYKYITISANHKFNGKHFKYPKGNFSRNISTSQYTSQSYCMHTTEHYAS